MGLSASGLELSDGVETISPAPDASSALFPTPLAPGSHYVVKVTRQPAPQVCSVKGGSGTARASQINWFEVSCSSWIWQGGSAAADTRPFYTDNPADQGRVGAATWTGIDGVFWMYGGGWFSLETGHQFQFGDLWQYAPVTEQWIPAGGSMSAIYGEKGKSDPANAPGARRGAVTWTGLSGDLWIFGGLVVTMSNSQQPPNPRYDYEYRNDLWRYSPSTGMWTWMSGGPGQSTEVHGTKGVAAVGNVPGALYGASTWIDLSGDLWLFGGGSNDLWRYSPSTGLWAWMSGSSTAAGVYGIKGTADAQNSPAARSGSVSGTDANGNFWLFGGTSPALVDDFGRPSYLNDLWLYSPNTGLWTWVSGSSAINAQPSRGSFGVPDPTNDPGGRTDAVAWSDGAGNLWLFGGNGHLDPASTESTVGPGVWMNDLWRYSASSGLWTWMSGSSSAAGPGNYGMKGIPSAYNTPGARYGEATWQDAAGHHWLLSGFGPGLGFFSDIWEYVPPAEE